MRSGTSFFNWTVFKKTVCRFWPLWGAYFAIWLVLLPLNGLMTLQYSTGRGANGAMGSFAIDTVPQLALAQGYGLVLVVVFGALCAMAVFSHLYSARPANFFGSLPVRREGLFLTHYLAGLAFLVIPNLAIFLLTLLVELAGGYVCWAGLGFWLAVMCGEGFFFYSLAVFCAMFTGHSLALPVFYGIINVLAIGIYGLLELVFQGFYYGFAGFPDGAQAVVKWLTPAAQLEEAVAAQSMAALPISQFTPEELAQVAELGGIWVSDTRYLIVRGLGTVGIYAAAAAALTVCAFFLYRARRLESAGDVVAVNPMKPVFQYGVALCVGMAFGMATVMVAGGGEIMLMAAMLVWGVLGYFAARMLLEKSFRVFGKWKGALAVAAVFVALFCVVGYDLTGFETRVPDPAGVDSVYVSGINAVCLGDDGDYLSLDAASPEAIELFTALHKEAVAQRDVERQTQAQLGGVNTHLSLAYTLKGGGTLERRYSLWLDPEEMDREGTAAWAVQRLYDNRELYWEVYGFAGLEEAMAGGVRLDRVDVGRYDEAVGATLWGALYGGDARALLAAVKEDFFAGRIGVRRVDDTAHWHGGPVEDSLQFFSGEVPKDDSYTYYNVRIALQDTASSTLAALEELADRIEVDGQGTWTDGLPDTVVS